MTSRLKVNKIKCKKCNDIIESKHGHDFKYCKCGSVFIDGGLLYQRMGFPNFPIEDWIKNLSEYS